MADKPLLRRKSDLPADILTQKSLESYQVHIFVTHYDSNLELSAVIVLLTIVFSVMIFNYRMLRNVFGMSSTP